VIHVLTVHWQDDSWVDIQLTYLHKFIQQPFKVYAFLNGLPQEHRAKYFYSSTEPIQQHAIKLNILADMAAFNKTDSDDLLMFIDGDAFPIGDVITFGREKLRQYPLIAIQRKENGGDIQPHPCFSLTTVKFWEEINGDWNAGYRWENLLGKSITDVGGNLLGILREKEIDWYPMLRSNKRNPHPVFFGLYEDLVYHHGAAFRRPLTRADEARISAARAKLVNWLPTRRLKKIFDPARKITKDNSILVLQIFEMIKQNPSFYRYFQQSG